MSEVQRPRRRRRFFGVLLLLAAALPARADDPKAETRVEAGRSLGGWASLFRRQAGERSWRLIQDKETLYSGDLLVGGNGGVMTSKNGAVRLGLMGEFKDHDLWPIFESAVVLHPATDVDLDFSLDRGRIDLVNLKESGPAKVRVHIGPLAGEITLAAPGDRAAVEIYGRWLPGDPFHKELKPGEGPTISAYLLALKGEVELKGPKHTFNLTAPALLMTSDLGEGSPPKVQPLDKLPEWATPPADPEEAAKSRRVPRLFRKLLIVMSIPEALDLLIDSNDPDERKFAVLAMGALDEMERLGVALRTAKHADVADEVVVAMRHWIGRGPGQDQKLYKGLVEVGKFPENQAEAVLSLLHGFSAEEIGQPELYETLIDYLECDKPALRCLAYWHLVRLAPAGESIPYEIMGKPEEQQKAAKEWRKLIPRGKLPPKPKTTEKDK